ncbi:hypothetical protein X777_12263 [Ooceraea biroi]|uniref:DNA-directed DNA polymerase n=1 Tax=Ooceraea biroi TaxID=2015173 RepID=A0A026W0J5_OOCBI|nr:hypothetical protein X777_12263 [Ooceraea biroi]
MHAGCYITLPEEIKTKKAVVNVRSMDNACFAWAVVAALYPAERNTERQSSYPHYTTVLNLQGVEFPVTLKDIGKFERLNNSVSINVFGTEEHNKKINVLPLGLTDNKRDKHVNLLYVQDPRDNDLGHFAWIKNMSHLQGEATGCSYIYSCSCLHYFHSNGKLEAHSVDCQKMNDCAIVLPNEDNKWLSFSNYNRKERMPFVVYADLECVLEKRETPENANTYPYQHHQVHSIAYYVQCSYDEALSGYRSRRDKECVAWFVEELRNLAYHVKAIISRNIPMVDLTLDEYEKFNSATHCHMCEKPFASDDTRIRHHCHLTGRYRGPAHANCNLNYKDSHTIPIVFHNLSGYDAHFIIKEIATAFAGNVELLPITKEKYISFTKHVNESDDKKWRNHVQLRFIDSFKFLSSSLDKLSSFLNKDKLRIVRSEFAHLSTGDFDLLTRKGVFPYEYVDCAEKLEDTRLPPRESFYSSLTSNTVFESDYAHAVNVWQRFSVGTLGEYSDLYLKTDVLLLADVFENFRDSCIESYGLDPAYYYTLPGFTWDATIRANIRV